MTTFSRLAVFDFDSTLAQGETIDVLGAAHGAGGAISAITAQAMQGDLDFHGALIERVRLLRGMPLEAALAAVGTIEPMPGADTLVAGLKDLGCRVVVISGGFTIATDLLQARIGYETAFANELHVVDGVLTGSVGGPAMFSHSKGKIVAQLQALLQIAPADTLVCGDGANDLSMFPGAGLKVAFGTKGVLDAHADVVVKDHDLSLVLPFAEVWAQKGMAHRAVA